MLACHAGRPGLIPGWRTPLTLKCLGWERVRIVLSLSQNALIWPRKIQPLPLKFYSLLPGGVDVVDETERTKSEYPAFSRVGGYEGST